MKTLIVYDSVFGNTEQIARAIAAGLGILGEVDVIKVAEAVPNRLQDANLLVVGSPTRQFQATPATTALLKTLPAGSLTGVRVAAFDTRIDAKEIKSAIGRFFVSRGGYAAPRLAKLLIQLGGAQAQAPEGFIVNASEGPLRAGELERATAWAARLSG